MFCLRAESVRLVADQGNDHAVEVEEEHQEVEAELDEGFLYSRLEYIQTSQQTNRTDLLVYIQLAEDLGRVQQMLVIVNPDPS